MKVFITGGSGMVGKNLVELFVKRKIDILYPTSEELNLLDKVSLNQFIKDKKPNVIIHCAGLVGGIHANIKNPYSFLNINLEMGLNIVQCAIDNGIEKFINLGSSCMYPAGSDSEIKESEILTGPLEKTNEGYAIAKIAVAKLCEFAKKELGINYKTIIPCNLYGKWDKFDPKTSHMIPGAIRKIHEAKSTNISPIIWGDGTARREFMYSEDLADFIHWSFDNYNLLESYTNLGIGKDLSILEYYQEISKVVGFNGSFEYDLKKPTGMQRKLCSIEKQKKLGWKPKHSLEQGLKKTYEFYIKQYGI
tara:strand:- start:222 stop:1139 length:918 start_codon:yes stop_codon:yes gene_type:complete